MKAIRLFTICCLTGFFVLIFLQSCSFQKNEESGSGLSVVSQEHLNNLLDSFHLTAAQADFEKYFNYYTPDAIFTGTDANKRWDKKQFMAYAKPYFDRGKAWNFTSLERHIYTDPSNKVAWFDELLKTQMKICRGSGVLINQNGDWKIAQYILTATVPNEIMDSVVKLKTPIEDEVIKKLESKGK